MRPPHRAVARSRTDSPHLELVWPPAWSGRECRCDRVTLTSLLGSGAASGGPQTPPGLIGSFAPSYSLGSSLPDVLRSHPRSPRISASGDHVFLLVFPCQLGILVPILTCSGTFFLLSGGSATALHEVGFHDCPLVSTRGFGALGACVEDCRPRQAHPLPSQTTARTPEPARFCALCRRHGEGRPHVSFQAERTWPARPLPPAPPSLLPSPTGSSRCDRAWSPSGRRSLSGCHRLTPEVPAPTDSAAQPSPARGSARRLTLPTRFPVPPSHFLRF